MSKLEPKGKAGERMNITSVAEMLKNPTQVVKEENTGVDVLVNTKLEDILEEIENKDYTCTTIVYIDSELKEVLNLLKSRRKINTSSLVSYLVEQFVNEHRDDINAIVRRKNRFL
jgi:ABC-type uncharacterized transport system ATPase subunit